MGLYDALMGRDGAVKGRKRVSRDKANLKYSRFLGGFLQVENLLPNGHRFLSALTKLFHILS